VSKTSGIRLVVQTPNGIKLIVTNKPLITAAPDVGAHSGLRFGRERAVSLSIIQLQRGHRLHLRSTGTLAFLSVLPVLYQISPAFVNGIYLVRYGSEYGVPEDKAKANFVATAETSARHEHHRAGAGSALIFLDPLAAPSAAIKDGFCTSLDGL
jgi:hypothetical protein